MLSKAKITQIQALEDKKQRQKQGLFLVEGPKVVEEVLQQQEVELKGLYGLATWAEAVLKPSYPQYLPLFQEVSEQELAKISRLKTPNQVLAVLALPKAPVWPKHIEGLALCLDTLQDPGNLGTLIRIADWFGIEDIFCAPGSADWHNPKVLQASMGSFLRVRVHYAPLPDVWAQYPQLPVYGALLEGRNLYETQAQKPAFLLIGNESKGISPELRSYISQGLRIPRLGGAESLNAAVATGIFCAWAYQDAK